MLSPPTTIFNSLLCGCSCATHTSGSYVGKENKTKENKKTLGIFPIIVREHETCWYIYSFLLYPTSDIKVLETLKDLEFQERPMLVNELSYLVEGHPMVALE